MLPMADFLFFKLQPNTKSSDFLIRSFQDFFLAYSRRNERLLLPVFLEEKLRNHYRKIRKSKIKTLEIR
jgi:hypothetical protein